MDEVTIWSQEDCMMCEAAKTFFESKGYTVDERPISKLMTGEAKHMDAMVALAMQNNVLPLVRVNGVFKKPGEYE